MEVIKDNIKFKLFKKNHTASVTAGPKNRETLLIPRFVEHNGEQYKIISINKNAFFFNTVIKNLIFADDSEIESFENGAFYSCSNLTKIQIPRNFKFFGDDWCSICSSLCEIEVSPDNKYFSYIENKFLVGKSQEDNEIYDTLYFTRRGIKEVVIPPQIKFFHKSSLQSNYNLKSIIFPSNSNVKNIDVKILPYDIKRLVLPGTIESIDPSNFLNCYRLEEISIAGENKTISIIDNKFLVKKSKNSRKTFDELIYLFCHGEVEVVVPPQIKIVKKYSFENNYQLKSVVFPSNSQLKIIEQNAFDKIERLILPGSVEDIYQNDFSSFENLKEIKFEGKSNNYLIVDSKLVLKKNDQFDEIIFAMKDIKTAVIPSFVKSISKLAFSNCKRLTTVTFAENSSIETISENAFAQCQIDKYVFPESIKKIDKRAFFQDENLISVQINSQNMSIEMDCFEKCDNLEVISFPNATQIDFNYSSCKLQEEIEIRVRGDVELKGYFSRYNEQIKYFYEPEKTTKEIKNEIKSKPNTNTIKKEKKDEEEEEEDDDDEIIDQQRQRYQKQLQRYLEHIRFLEKRLSRYEQVKPFDPSQKEQKEETDYEVNEEYEQEKRHDITFIDEEDEKKQEIISKIGEGNSSIAYKIIDHRDSRVLCKKVLKENEYSIVFPEFRKKMKEMEVLQQDRHPCICEVIGVNINEHFQKESDKSEHQTASFFFEYLPYNIKKCQSMNILNNTLKTKIAIEIAFGMSFIHSRKQIHRNLNINNIRLNDIYESKIINFAQVHVSDFETSSQTLTKSIGEFAYMSPEMAREEDYDEKTDVYSYGVILHSLFSGKPPKQSMEDKMNKKKPKYAEASEWISSNCIKLIKKCMAIESSQRPSFDDILEEIYSKSFDLASEIDKSSVLHRYQVLNRFKSQYQNKS